MMRSPIANIKDAVITDYFRAPKCEQCSGNRGIELQLNPGEPIFAVADGLISFHGEVNRTNISCC